MITIVTAFFDIGRASWTAFPRSVDNYFRNFERLCLLDNPVVLFTESCHKHRLLPLQGQKSNLVIFYEDDLFDRHGDLLDAINRVQQSAEFRQGITNPQCPEYNQPKYVLINYLKSYFCTEAIHRIPDIENTIAWIDFGYLRHNRQLPLSLRWDFNFGENITVFSLRPVDENIDLVKTIKDNTSSPLRLPDLSF